MVFKIVIKCHNINVLLYLHLLSNNCSLSDYRGLLKHYNILLTPIFKWWFMLEKFYIQYFNLLKSDNEAVPMHTT